MLGYHILEFWHAVEFFQAFDLSHKIELKELSYFLLPHQLKDQNLPWLDPRALLFAGGEPGKRYRYHMYFFPFDRSELSKRALKARTAVEETDWQERLQVEGKTCFGKLKIDTDGTPNFPSFSLSTLPWALGKLSTKKLKEVCRDNFETDTEMLHLELCKIPLAEGKLDAQAIALIAECLIEWSKFLPPTGPVIGIELCEIKQKSKEKLIEHMSAPLEEEEEKELFEKSILNSFYIRDIEKALMEGFDQSALKPLLEPAQNLLDLETERGRDVITKFLSPKYFPLSRWPSLKVSPLPLMQHFAVSQALFGPQVFSVNGPPGTGKTTLIREVIADKITRRALVLATLSDPKEAIRGTLHASFGNGIEVEVSLLAEELVGYEIVIASSNNHAVEILSKELPLKKKVLPGTTYMKSVSDKLASKHDKRGRPKPLDEETFGLIAAPLGNRNNCKEFTERLFFLKGVNQEKETIWDWARSKKNLSFDVAKKNFLNRLKELNGFRSKLDELFRMEELQREAPIGLEKEIAGLQESRVFLDKAMESSPHLKEQLEPIRLATSQQLEEKRKLWVDGGWSERREKIFQLKNLLGIKTPPDPLVLEDSQIQGESFWQCEEEWRLSTLLFQTALQLHEAFLYEMVQKGEAFRGNLIAISQLVSGRRPTLPEAVLPIWQSLFFLVPAISTTFASFARLFEGVGEAAFGLLMIDEAGQAVPSAAVGAFWRAKKALVLGDPFQIEPVLTIPPALVDILASDRLGEAWSRYSPTVQSVQTIADRANPLGVYLERGWIGTPLRVHRRCLDPMFSIANQIAYDNSMVQKVDASSFEKSYWLHVEGKVSDGQYVPEVGRAVVDFLIEEVKRTDTLPNAFVITPFRKVREGVSKAITSVKWDPKLKVGKWIQERVGTVHTFQGKEEDRVLFVLGGDESCRGALRWASEKPNLVNVAVTRAKRQLIVIGNARVWGALPYFQTLFEALK